jgi:hypothetical protein
MGDFQMNDKNISESSSRTETLLKEYGFCQEASHNSESKIWQTSSIIGLGLIGTFILVITRLPFKHDNWVISALLGLFSVIVGYIWWKIARRWWSVQHAMFVRMRHIEQELDMYIVRYVDYLDELSKCGTSVKMDASNLSEQQKNDLRYRVNVCIVPWIKDHQRSGVQIPLLSFLFLNFVVWLVYSGVLYFFA